MTVAPILLLVSLAMTSPIQEPVDLGRPKGYVCYRAARAITVDGRLDEADWRRAPWTDVFVDIEGSAKPKPRFRTRAKMLWDERYFYVAAKLEEPHVWATLTEHDSVIFHDNDFEVFIDPDGDNHEYYEIEINALNTEWDLRLPKPYRDGGSAIDAWEIPGLKTAVHVSGTLNDTSDRDRGWTVEMAFPWKVLGEFANRPAPPRDGDRWRVNFSRVEWQVHIVDGKYVKVPGRREANWVWSPQGVVDMHRPEKWGYVQFSAMHPDPGHHVTFRPDPAWPIRSRLMHVYYLQRAFQEKHGRWAASAAELGIGNSVDIQGTSEGYEATLDHWRIRQDSMIWEGRRR